ncbi:MAG: PLP-dependent transferase [Clostridia bacterium]|nr:PLP-dependent transferase [Clostridia bacterium]
MKTPIRDFVARYAEGDACRLHMPGHKGVAALGAEPFDITEIDGADSLYEARGIIRESEKNASALFGAETLYSAEGASLAIRTMLALVAKEASERGERCRVLAGRNAHRAFLSAAVLLDIEVDWLYAADGSYLSCPVDEKALAAHLAAGKYHAVYLTSPDYLGNTADIAAASALCRRYGVLLLVDNAHGAYLKFLPESRHPMDLGADICCDSAHKTLPALTGAAYLHLSHAVASRFAPEAKQMMALFGSTSPSYLILQSLDLVNAYLADGYAARLAAFVAAVADAKERLAAQGYALCGDEPLKLTVAPKSYDYEGYTLAAILAEQGFVSEFSDPDFTVMMLTPEVGDEALAALVACLCALPRRAPITEAPPTLTPAERVCSPRKALFAPHEVVALEKARGRVLADIAVACPPAVPIVVAGERIDQAAQAALAYYGAATCTVIKE